MDPLERPALAPRLLVAYYLATPLFAVLDFRGGVDLRAVFLDQHPAARILFYAILFALGLLASQRQVLAPVVAVIEGGVSIGLLAVSVFSAYLAAVESLAGPGAPANPFTAEAVGNLILSAAALVIGQLSIRARGGRFTTHARDVLLGS